MIESGAVPLFIQLLTSVNEDVREQAAWAIGNIAGDSVHCRDYVLNLNAFDALGQVFTEHARLSTIRNATWTLSNLCRGKPAPNFSLVEPALPLLARLIFSQDIETVTDACWALSYISDGPNERIQAVLDAGVSPRLVELLSQSNQSSVQTPALRAVGNIVTGDDAQTQHIVNLNVIPALCWLLDSPKKNIRKEACWTLSNITAGTPDQIQFIIEAGVFPKLIDMLRGSEFEIQKEAAWAISNATSGGNHQQLMYIAQLGAIPPLCQLLQASEVRILTVALEGLENIINAAKAQPADVFEQVVEAFHNCDGVTAIEHLQNHATRSIYERATRLIEVYFGGEEEEDAASQIVPEVNGNQFQFGMHQQQFSAGGFKFN